MDVHALEYLLLIAETGSVWPSWNGKPGGRSSTG